MRFRQKGAIGAGTAQPEAAIAFNPFVPGYLWDKKRLLKRLPPYISFGDEHAALPYAVDAKDIWRKDAEALGWLRKTLVDMDFGEGAEQSGERCHKEVGTPDHTIGYLS
ncbi:MAG: hypothetical protein M5R40_26210 [Anaerolineae bacterium]|nr:hypothetical protein [Anaerolineae bacterium]